MAKIYNHIKVLIPSFIKSKVKDIIANEGKIIHSYAQSGEDILLKKYFNRKIWAGQTGFFVDVGAYHPKVFSNTYLFYQFGWRGINIDARPGSMKLFNDIRPEDINLEYAISSKQETLKYFMSEKSDTINTFSREFIRKNNYEKKYTDTIELKTETLVSIFDKYVPISQSIDFLTIDVEGFDEKVLRSNDWDKYRPEVVVVEIPGIDFEKVLAHPSARFLKKHRYYPFDRTILYGNNNLGSIFFHDGLKEFYPRI